MRLTKTGVVVGPKLLRFADFPEYVEKHLRRVPHTKSIERFVTVARRAGFPAARLRDLIRRVCNWGGYPGIAGRVLRHPLVGTRRRFRSATVQLNGTPRGAKEALGELLGVHGLGVSFASKHLRFLEPAACGVLDSVMEKAGRGRYPKTPVGYGRYCQFCQDVGRELQLRRIKNPMRRSGTTWFAAEVDMALFAWLSRW